MQHANDRDPIGDVPIKDTVITVEMGVGALGILIGYF
jgi:hypothetical protein